MLLQGSHGKTSLIQPYIAWNLFDMPAGIVPGKCRCSLCLIFHFKHFCIIIVDKVNVEDDQNLDNLPSNDLVSTYTVLVID